MKLVNTKILLILFFITITSFGDTIKKIRIKKFPIIALQYLDSNYHERKKTKYYLIITDSNEKFYKAEFELNKQKTQKIFFENGILKE